MKVYELKELLSKYPDDYEVLIASDEEMNTVQEIAEDAYEGMWDGDEFIQQEDWEDMYADGHNPEDESDYPGNDSIVLTP
jgi:hypothetical protein